MKEKLAVQLYTVRDACREDFPGTLRRLAGIGYAGVQFAGFHGRDPRELKAVLEETGLRAAGLHVGLDEVLNETERLAADARLLGTPDLIVPAVAAELRSESGYREVKEKLNLMARKLEAEGFRVSYHNHAFEFETSVDGRDALTYLLDPAPDNRILAEIDVYWVRKAGHDPLAFIAPYAGRMPIVHLKDIRGDESQAFAEIGTGIIDFAPLLRWGESSGVEWYVVEQDVCPGDPMESVETSYRNLSSLIESL